METSIEEWDIEQMKKAQFLINLARPDVFGNRGMALAMIGETKATLRRWRLTDFAFEQQFQDALDMFVDIAESRLFKLINEGNIIAIMFYLKSHAKNRGYSENYNVVHSVAQPVEFEIGGKRITIAS